MKLRTSIDLPDYLKSKYTQVVPLTNSSRPLKSYKAALLNGVSQEAPANFHLSHIQALTHDQKVQQKVGKSFELKPRRPQFKSFQPFDYEDFRDANFDYDGLVPSRAVHLMADKAPGLRAAHYFNKHYSKWLSQGFGQVSGEFASSFKQAHIPRFKGKTRLTQASRHASFLKVLRQAHHQPRDKYHQESEEKRSIPKFRAPWLIELDKFDEDRKKVKLSQAERRNLFSIDDLNKYD